MYLCVVRVRERLYEFVPVGLVLSDVVTEPRNERAVVSLDLTVGLRMIRRCGQVLHTERRAHSLEELRSKLNPVV